MLLFISNSLSTFNLIVWKRDAEGILNFFNFAWQLLIFYPFLCHRQEDRYVSFLFTKGKSDDGQNALFQKLNTKNASCTGL